MNKQGRTIVEESEENEVEEDNEEEEEEDIIVNGLLKNKIFKKIPTTTDTIIMTEMLEHVILPNLVQKRNPSMNRISAEFTVPPSRNAQYQTRNSESSSSSTSTSSSSPNIPIVETDFSRIPPPILVYLDGDYPQTMALVNEVLNIFEDDMVSVLK